MVVAEFRRREAFRTGRARKGDDKQKKKIATEVKRLKKHTTMRCVKSRWVPFLLANRDNDAGRDPNKEGDQSDGEK